MITMYMYSTVILLIYFATTSPTIGQDTLCAQELCRPCRALCGDDTFIDIATIFRYPVTVSDSGGRQYEYTFSPCEGVNQCSEAETYPSAVCQTTTDKLSSWSLGSMLFVNWYFNQTYPYNYFIIEYQHGDLIAGVYRKTRVTFIDDPSVDPPTLVFVAETPILEYLFEVRGKNIIRLSHDKNPFEIKQENNQSMEDTCFDE